MNTLKAFQIKSGQKVLDYRVGQNLDLVQVGHFFAKEYVIKNLWQGGRHVLGLIEKNNKEYFLKLATTDGIGETTKIEFEWNIEFNKIPEQKINFCVPRNIDCGLYNNNLFYLITEKFEGRFLSQKPRKEKKSNDIIKSLKSVIDFSGYIQNLKIKNLSERENGNHTDIFLTKTKMWFNGIPKKVREEYCLSELLETVKNGAKKLKRETRHGDFTPWHIIKLNNGKLGLIDGEHAMANGVEYYDIGYFIQRVFCILEEKEFAKKIFSVLLRRNYNAEKLQTVLASRAIGGFLDESLKPQTNYFVCNEFKTWIKNLT